MKKNDGFTLIELLVTLVIVGVIMTFIISMMSSQYAIIRDVDAYLVLSAENKDVNDRIIQEFVASEDIFIDAGDGYKSIVTNSGISAYFDNNGLPLFKTRLYYYDSELNEAIYIVFKRDDDEANNLVMEKYKESNDVKVGDSLTIGTHLSSNTTLEPTVTFYRRLSQDRRVVSLVKVKINYLHDGITKQYDLFYHLRNLQFN
jgi:prepilin-type N-terminal cleavage/methylation domain-containing protein